LFSRIIALAAELFAASSKKSAKFHRREGSIFV
jgi:hypothetical protein